VILAVVAPLITGIVAVGFWAATVPCLQCVLTPDEVHRGPATHASNERCGAGGPLKTLASAQADFRAGDRDANGVEDFWRKDVAGLYVTPGVNKLPIRLIELRLALADARPASDLGAIGKQQPYAGYWIRAILHEGEDPAKPDPQRFAYVAYPVEYPKHDRNTYIIDENNTTYRNVLPPGTSVTVFPKDPGEAGWSKLD